MKLLFNRDEKVIVTRGYLMAFGGMMMSVAGMGIDQGQFLPSWIGLAMVAVGLAILVLCFPHLMTKPEPLNEGRTEAEG